MKVLVTGASGFLGRWLVKRLHQDGFDLRILARRSSNIEDLPRERTEIVYGDVTDLRSLVDACMGVDGVFHLAGKIAYDKKEYESMFAINVGGTKNIIEACKKAKVTKILYLSSVVAIGSSREPKVLNEDSPYTIANLKLGYFDSKHEAEKLILSAYRRGDIKPLIVNPSTIYGAGDATKSSRNIQRKVALGKFPFYTSGGVNVVYAQDVIDMIMLLWKKEIYGERFILAGENISIQDLFSEIAEAAGVKPPQIHLPNAVVFGIGKIGDLLSKFDKKGPLTSENACTSTMYHWFDSSKAQRVLGFRPTPAKIAIRESVEWMLKNEKTLG
jgi:dihydroflavonol-4-reductase